MSAYQNAIMDTDIIFLIQKNDSLGWEYLHDKFALTMYIAILWVISDERRAHEILNMIFSQFKTNIHLLETQRSLSESLLYHTCITSLKVLRINELEEKKSLAKPCDQGTHFNHQQQ